MKISELIKELTDLQEEYGDLPVCVIDPDLMADGHMVDVPAHLVLNSEEDEEVTSVTVIDLETKNSLE